MTAAGIGNSGDGFSAISRRNLEPAAEGRTADSRKADAPVAVTLHLEWQLGQHAVLPLPQGKHSPYTLYSILHTLTSGPALGSSGPRALYWLPSSIFLA